MSFVSPLLWHTDCPFDHVSVNDPAEAAALVRARRTVCVPGPEEAVEALILLGLSEAEARHQITIWEPVS